MIRNSFNDGVTVAVQDKTAPGLKTQEQCPLPRNFSIFDPSAFFFLVIYAFFSLLVSLLFVGGPKKRPF